MGTLQWLCKSLYKDVMYFGNPPSRSVEGTVQMSVSKFSNFFVAMLFKAVMCNCWLSTCTMLLWEVPNLTIEPFLETQTLSRGEKSKWIEDTCLGPHFGNLCQ